MLPFRVLGRESIKRVGLTMDESPCLMCVGIPSRNRLAILLIIKKCNRIPDRQTGCSRNNHAKTSVVLVIFYDYC